MFLGLYILSFYSFIHSPNIKKLLYGSTILVVWRKGCQEHKEPMDKDNGEREKVEGGMGKVMESDGGKWGQL